MLSRYLSHALVLVVTLAVGAFVAPAAIGAHRQTASAAPFEQAMAISDDGFHVRLAVAAAGCAAPPAVPTNATLTRLEALQHHVQTALDGCAARIEALNKLQASLTLQMVADQQRITAEKSLMAGLARLLYRQPQSALVAFTSSRSLGDFITQWSDEQSAGARARALNDQLLADQARLQEQTLEVTAARNEEVGVRSALQNTSNRLQQIQNRLLAELAAQPVAPSGFVLPAGPAQVIQDIVDAFSPLGQTAVAWALRVAKCESGYNPNAVNPWSGTEGLFQFEPSTWRSTPYGSDNVFDPKYNSLGAAWLYHRDGPSQWQCS